VKNRHSTHRGVNERYRLWLLKNSIIKKWPKKLCIRKPYKRLSRFGWTFSITQNSTVLGKTDFFNTHAWLQQLTFGIARHPRSICATDMPQKIHLRTQDPVR
jgi:hypothetical protein